VAAQEAVAQQNKQGGATVGIETPAKPGTIKMRRSTVRFGSLSRSVVLYDSTQTLVVGDTHGTINLNHGPGPNTSDTFTAIGSVIAEKRPRGSVMSTAS